MPLLGLKCALSNRFALVEGSSKLKLLLEAAPVDPSREFAPSLNLTLIIDRSTSMMGEALDSVKRAAFHMIDSLADSDCVAIVGFSDQVSVVSGSQPLVDRAAIKQAVERLRAQGATNIHGAIDLGHREAMRHYSADRINRMLFLSDGEATAGITEDDQILALADSARRDGLSISTLGVGEEYDEMLLGQIARRGGGNHYFIQTPDAIPRIFQEELAKAKSVIAKNVMVRVQPQGETQVRMLNQRYRCETVGEEFVVYLDELEAARPQATILDLEVVAREAGEYVPVTAQLIYDNLLDHTRGETVRGEIRLEYVTEGSRIRAGINREVLRRWEELSAMQDLKVIVDQVKDRRIDAKTAVLELDRKTQVLVKKKAIEAARVLAAVSRTIVEEGGVSTSLAKRTMVECEEVEKGATAGKTIIEE